MTLFAIPPWLAIVLGVLGFAVVFVWCAYHRYDHALARWDHLDATAVSPDQPDSEDGPNWPQPQTDRGTQ